MKRLLNEFYRKGNGAGIETIAKAYLAAAAKAFEAKHNVTILASHGEHPNQDSKSFVIDCNPWFDEPRKPNKSTFVFRKKENAKKDFEKDVEFFRIFYTQTLQLLHINAWVVGYSHGKAKAGGDNFTVFPATNTLLTKEVLDVLLKEIDKLDLLIDGCSVSLSSLIAAGSGEAFECEGYTETVALKYAPTFGMWCVAKRTVLMTLPSFEGFIASLNEKPNLSLVSN